MLFEAILGQPKVVDVTRADELSTTGTQELMV